VRQLVDIDVPVLGKLRHVLRVLVVAEARELAVAARLAVVLCCRLPVHLVNACTFLADHPTYQVDVWKVMSKRPSTYDNGKVTVDLASGRCGLVTLVYTLKSCA
jgi:hypothetical protein